MVGCSPCLLVWSHWFYSAYVLYRALNQIRNREDVAYKSQKCMCVRVTEIERERAREKGTEREHVIACVFSVCMDFTLIHSLSFIFFTWGTADEFQMLPGFMFLSSLPDNYHPIITLTQVLILNYKPITKLIFSHRCRACNTMQNFRWILSLDFCAFPPHFTCFTLGLKLTF